MPHIGNAMDATAMETKKRTRRHLGAHAWREVFRRLDGSGGVCLQRLTGRIRLTEGQTRRALKRSIQQNIAARSEPYLLAFAYRHLGEKDLLIARTDAEQSLLLSTLNLVECIAFAAARIRQTTRPQRV